VDVWRNGGGGILFGIGVGSYTLLTMVRQSNHQQEAQAEAKRQAEQPQQEAQAAQQTVPGCESAWRDLEMRRALLDAKTLIGTDCPVMYREGWLVNSSKLTAPGIPSCGAAWNALASKGALSSARFLVVHDCPVLRRNGLRP
jgi:hypothetical protein